VLVIMAGLPATGKTTVARGLARALGAVHLRIDTIEQAVVRSGIGTHPLGPVGYVVAYALAADLLRQGLTVVADSVNPLALTRDGWHEVARSAGVGHVDVEVICSDRAQHRDRATGRVGDIEGLRLPTWEQIEAREYEPWQTERVVVDTAGRTVDACVTEVVDALKDW
jgi:predicted kinase